MTCGVYLVTNLLNGLRYVGQSVNIQRRWKSHRFCKDDTYFHRAICKHGIGNFKFEILLECAAERLNYYEIACIAEYNAFSEEGYNLSEGGLTHRGYVATPEHRQNMSKARLGEKRGEEFKARMRELKKGCIPSEATLAACRAVNKGNSYAKGHTLSDELKKKLVEKYTGVPLSEEHKRKLKENHASRKHDLSLSEAELEEQRLSRIAHKKEAMRLWRLAHKQEVLDYSREYYHAHKVEKLLPDKAIVIGLVDQPICGTLDNPDPEHAGQ